jgi:hypothetical protein
LGSASVPDEAGCNGLPQKRPKVKGMVMVNKVGSIVAVSWALLVGVQGYATAQSSAIEEPSSSVSRSVPTAKQQAYLNASLGERVRLAERIGDDGARQFAAAKGWTPLFDGTSRKIAQGPDQVYQGADGAVHVIEAKGGSSPLGRAYGFRQGTSEWAVASAKNVLGSSQASPSERSAANAVIEAAARREMSVHVVRTKHVLGEPVAAVLESASRTSEEAAGVARSALEFKFRPIVTRCAADTSKLAGKAGVAGTVSTSLAGVGVVVDGASRVRDAMSVERRFAAGEITQQEREIDHVRNAAGFVGGWGAAVPCAEGGALVGGAIAGPVGAPIGGIGGGIGGYFGGEAVASHVAEWGVRSLHSTGTTISDSSKTAWRATANAASKGGAAVSRAWKWVRGE